MAARRADLPRVLRFLGIGDDGHLSLSVGAEFWETDFDGSVLGITVDADFYIHVQGSAELPIGDAFFLSGFRF